MNTYQVYGYLTISVTATVKAEDRAEAMRIAGSLSAPSLCHRCSDAGGGDGDWQLNGFDDPPDDVVRYVEEIE